MALLDHDLSALFGAAFASLYRDAVLIKLSAADDGSGGFATAQTPQPAKVLVEAVSDRARAASGLPDQAVSLSILRAGLPVPVDLDDEITLDGRVYRVIRLDTDPAGAAYRAAAVPA